MRYLASKIKARGVLVVFAKRRSDFVDPVPFCRLYRCKFDFAIRRSMSVKYRCEIRFVDTVVALNVDVNFPRIVHAGRSARLWSRLSITEFSADITYARS